MRDIADTLAFLVLKYADLTGIEIPERGKARKDLTDRFEEFLDNLPEGTIPEEETGYVEELAPDSKLGSRLGGAQFIVKLKAFPNRTYFFKNRESAEALILKAAQGGVE